MKKGVEKNPSHSYRIQWGAPQKPIITQTLTRKRERESDVLLYIWRM